MLRALGRYAVQVARNSALLNSKKYNPALVGAVRHSSEKQESDEEFDARYEAYFNRPDIDGWEVRKAMNDLQGMDLVPEPKIIIAAMKACRRLNDYALAVRYLEGVKDKCLTHMKIYSYIIQEIRPTLDELGINTPEEMGYNKPELWLQDMYEMPLFRKSTEVKQ